jgi:DNA-binding NtrC family response regulator
MISTPCSAASSQQLLIAEPDPLLRLLLCIALSGQFSDLHAVASFQEARALLAQHDFAAIIAEYHLSGGTGLALYKEVRRDGSRIPFVMMCGGIQVTLSDPYYRFFAKPFGLADLGASLAEVIALAQRG